MKRDEPLLNICSGAHLLSRSEQHADAPGVHRIEEQLLRRVGLGIMNKRDFQSVDTCLHKFATDIIVNIKSFRIGRRKIAKDELSGTLVLSRVPNLDDAGDREINLSLLLGLG